MGIEGKCASWLSFPMLSIPSGRGCAFFIGAWQAAEEAKPTRPEARKWSLRVCVVEWVDGVLMAGTGSLAEFTRVKDWNLRMFF